MYKGTISSRQNPLIVQARNLRNKKDRDESGLCFFEGEKLFEEAVKSGVDIKYIQSLLGHVDPRSTDVYLHVSNKTLLGIHSPFDDPKGGES